MEPKPDSPLCPWCSRAMDSGHLVVYGRYFGRLEPTRVWCGRERMLTEYPVG